MRAAAVAAAVVAAVSLAGSATNAASLPTVLAFGALEDSGGGIYVQRSGRARLVAAGGLMPAWSPDGRRLAYVAPSAGGSTDLFVVDADGTHRAPLTRTQSSAEATPSWAPDGRRLVVERDGQLFVVGADGRGERLLTSGRHPDWSPRRGRVAFVNTRGGLDDLYVIDANGRGLRRLTTSEESESEPSWSPDGTRVAFVSQDAVSADVYVLDLRSGGLVRLTQDPALESSPTWSRAGDSVQFVSERTGGGPIWSIPASGGDPASLGGPPSVERFRWRPSVSLELRPDLDQRPPTDLGFRVSGHGAGRRYLLGFTSASDNLGEGPLSIVASRPSHDAPTLRAAQRVRIAGGSARAYPSVGFLRYTVALPHRHWHLMDFQRYELRRTSDHTLVVRDRKSGFCLADHWAQAPGAVPGKPRQPVFASNCGEGNPSALSVSQGTSVGYTDRYPAYFHGQNLDVTRVPTGIYVLVHRSNANLLLRESRYENNAASVRIRLSWSRSAERRPRISVLAICASAEWCTG